MSFKYQPISTPQPVLGLQPRCCIHLFTWVLRIRTQVLMIVVCQLHHLPSPCTDHSYHIVVVRTFQQIFNSSLSATTGLEVGQVATLCVTLENYLLEDISGTPALSNAPRAMWSQRSRGCSKALVLWKNLFVYCKDMSLCLV